MMRHSPRTSLKGKQRVFVDGWLSPTPYFIILVSPQPTGWNTLADVKGVDTKPTNRCPSRLPITFLVWRPSMLDRAQPDRRSHLELTQRDPVLHVRLAPLRLDSTNVS